MQNNDNNINNINSDNNNRTLSNHSSDIGKLNDRSDAEVRNENYLDPEISDYDADIQ